MEQARQFAYQKLGHRLVQPGDAVMFDIDFTLLDPDTERPIQWVVDAATLARCLGYSIIVITARPGDLKNRMWTSQQLKSVTGLVPDKLYFAPPEHKTAVKQKLKWNIVMSFGDQWTDVGATRWYVKLPDTRDPKYYIG